MISSSYFEEPQQVQLAGMAHFDNANFLMFCPDERCVGRVTRFSGYAVQLTRRVVANERISICEAISQGAWLAIEAIKTYQSQR